MKNTCKRLTMLLLVFAIVVTTAAFPITAKAVDLSHPCSLTVIPGSSEFTAELTEAGVVIDLYLVADVREAKGSDSYTYSFLDAYSGLKISDNPDNREWRSLSQQATDIIFKESGGSPVVTGAASNKAITLTDSGRNLSAGLYLVVARGQGLQKYTTTITDDSGNERIATIARSQRHTYTFAPELVALPGKEADANGSMNTANRGEWLYDVSITLKPEQDSRSALLEINKTLLSYESSAPATFVFSIEAVLDGANVYSDVISLTFTKAGQASRRIDGIPTGAQVTVTEIYSGACYSLDTDGTQTVVIPSDGVVSVSFTNDYDGTANQGGSITNYFEYSGVTGWDWEQIPDKDF